MTTKPRKPLLVNLTWAVGAAVFIAVVYVGAYIGTWAMYGAELISDETVSFLDDTVFLPMEKYVESDLPGANRFGWWCHDVMDRASFYRR